MSCNSLGIALKFFDRHTATLSPQTRTIITDECFSVTIIHIAGSSAVWEAGANRSPSRIFVERHAPFNDHHCAVDPNGVRGPCALEKRFDCAKAVCTTGVTETHRRSDIV